MKKWLLISAMSLVLGAGALGMAYTNTDQASAAKPVATATVKSTTTKRTTKAAKASAKAAKPIVSSKQTPKATSTKTSTKTQTTAAVQPAASAPTKASQSAKTVKAQATVKPAAPAKATTAAAKAQAPTNTGLAAYYGTWHNADVTVTLTSTTMTVASAGQAGLMKTYTVVKSGAGYTFSPKDGSADALYLVLKNGQLEWITGTSSPLVLTK